MKEKIKKLFNIKDKDYYLTDEEVEDTLIEARNRLSDIFYKLMYIKELSLSESLMYNEEISNALEDLESFLFNIASDSEEYDRGIFLKIISKLLRNVICIILNIALPIIFSKAALPICLLMLIINIRNYKDLTNTEYPELYDFSKCADLLNECSIIGDNCIRFLHNRTENYQKNLDLDGQGQKFELAIDGATKLIYFYLETGILATDIPEDVYNMMIKLLQEDLKTTETDAKILLNMMEEKVKKELEQKGQKLTKKEVYIV